MSQWRLQDYLCPAGHRFESLESRASVPETKPCEVCGEPARKTISAAHFGTTWGDAAQRGKPQEPPGPAAVDTRPIAEGKLTQEEWKKKRRQYWRGRDYDEYRRKVR